MLYLKGRQIGFTWLCAAYTVWRMIYERPFRVSALSQERFYAQQFVERVKFIHSKLPKSYRREILKENESEFRLNAGKGLTTSIVSFVGSERVGRSLTGDLVIMDEASRIPALGASLGAVIPSLEHRKGQLIVLSTSAGPLNDFADLWRETYGVHGEKLNADGVGPSGFRPVFIHWTEVPGRDGAWYEGEKIRLDAIDPMLVKREYPDNPQEAFEHATGRLFPKFNEANIGRATIGKDFKRYRAIDWGESKSAYVVLWVANLPGAPPAFYVSPDCPNTIQEILNYRLDPDTGRPIKENDHTVDALRYLVTTMNLRGLIYVYREIYRKDSIVKGYSPLDEIKEIHELSGWRRADQHERGKWVTTKHGEQFVTTVYDRSLNKMGKLFREFDIPCQPCKTISQWARGKLAKDKPSDERMEGIRWLNELMTGTELSKHFVDFTQHHIPKRRKQPTANIERTRRLYARKYLTKIRKRR